MTAIRGVVGQIKWSYYTAAAINGYVITKSKDGTWSLRATVVNADAFKMKQRPLTFVAPHAKGAWRWPIDTLDMGSGVGPNQIRATLGQPLP